MFRVISKIFESVYNEFGKLGSLEEKLSPKLKALLAAGLIGTASLGMQSCAQPTDDNSSYPPAPTEEVKPKDDETPADDTKKGGTVEKYPVCKQLGIGDNLREEMTGATIYNHYPYYDEEEIGIIFIDKKPIPLTNENKDTYAESPAYMISKKSTDEKYHNYFILTKDISDNQQLAKLKTELSLQEPKSVSKTNK